MLHTILEFKDRYTANSEWEPVAKPATKEVVVTEESWLPVANDTKWIEEKHKRDDRGRFGVGQDAGALSKKRSVQDEEPQRVTLPEWLKPISDAPHIYEDFKNDRPNLHDAVYFEMRGTAVTCFPIGSNRTLGALDMPGEYISKKNATKISKELSKLPGFPNATAIKYGEGMWDVAWGDKDKILKFADKIKEGDHVWLGRAFGIPEDDIWNHVLSNRKNVEWNANHDLKFIQSFLKTHTKDDIQKGMDHMNAQVSSYTIVWKGDNGVGIEYKWKPREDVMAPQPDAPVGPKNNRERSKLWRRSKKPLELNGQNPAVNFTANADWEESWSPVTNDVEWKEELHHRGAHGRFGSSGGGHSTLDQGPTPTHPVESTPVASPTADPRGIWQDVKDLAATHGDARIRISRERNTAPPPGKAFTPNVYADRNGDGVTDAARVGVPAMSLPPPPAIPRLPNLSPAERRVEKEFAERFEAAPDKMAADFLEVAKSSTKEGQPVVFGTDDAKVLSPVWEHPSLSQEQRSQNRAVYNCALHQTANAIVKRAFVQHLDTLQPGDEITVTVGGCGAGKGFCLKSVPAVGAIKDKSKAVWDSAGDQNATENPWVQQEAEKRGLKVNYVYVHADPRVQWAHPERGVVKRAEDPKDGRMVDAHVFADSYALGAKNHAAFAAQHADNPSAAFHYIASGSPPTLHDGMPPEALKVEAGPLREFAQIIVADHPTTPPHVKKGALVGARIWGEK